MAFPPPTLPTNRSNATPQNNTHPADHNAVNGAVNDVVAEVSRLGAALPSNGSTSFALTDNSTSLPRNLNTTELVVFSVAAAATGIANPGRLDRLDLQAVLYAAKIITGTPTYVTYYASLAPGGITGETALVRHESATEAKTIPLFASATGLANITGPFNFQIYARVGTGSPQFDIQGGARVAVQWQFS